MYGRSSEKLSKKGKIAVIVKTYIYITPRMVLHLRDALSYALLRKVFDK